MTQLWQGVFESIDNNSVPDLEQTLTKVSDNVQSFKFLEIFGQMLTRYLGQMLMLDRYLDVLMLTLTI